MKRNQTESNGMILRNHSESYPGMTGKTSENDRKNDQKRPKTTENDRRISLRFCHFEEWIPRKFPDFPCIFLENSPIFRAFSSKIPRFSPIFSDFLRFSLKFSDYFPNCAVFYVLY